jgi:hypothetical protein
MISRAHSSANLCKQPANKRYFPVGDRRRSHPRTRLSNGQATWIQSDVTLHSCA